MIDKIRAGDEYAKEQFVNVLTPYLAKISTKLSITNIDLMSSINWVMTKILNNMHMLDKQKNVLSYISNSVKNFCIDEYRKVMVRKRREEDYKSMTSSKYKGIHHTLEFMLEDLTESEEEKHILTKIILEKQELDSISRELNIPRKDIDLLLERVRLELT